VTDVDLISPELAYFLRTPDGVVTRVDKVPYLSNHKDMIAGSLGLHDGIARTALTFRETPEGFVPSMSVPLHGEHV
jgi:hypothetical protein